MRTWLNTLKRGLARRSPQDRLGSRGRPISMGTGLGVLRPYVVRYWRRGLLGVLLVLASSLLLVPQPLVNRAIVDDVILSGRLGLLVWLVLLLVSLKVAGKVTDVLQRFSWARFEQDVLLDLQGDLLDRTLRFPKSFFDDQEVGYLMSRLLSDVQRLRWFFSGTLVHLLGQTLRFVGGVALLVSLEWRLAVIVLLTLPALGLCAHYFATKALALSHQSMEQHADVSRRVQESLSAATLIKAQSAEVQTTGSIISALRAALQVSLERTAVGSAADLVIQALPALARAVVLVAGAYWVVRGEWSLGSLLAFQGYLAYVYGPAQSLATANLQMHDAIAALERIAALHDIVPEENLGSGRVVERLSGRIEFRDVSFSYDGQDSVLEGLSCLVSPGEHVAVVGPSGVGKTTLISLILRFYKPTSGEIWFDGRPASDYELGSLRRRIGYVSQSALLLSGTIRDNLCYGNPQASQDQIERAARLAGIHDFVAALPQGYDSLVGERGANLSEGQKQRLAIARSLIGDPDILVLDEPTATLDGITERSLLDALPALLRSRTMFVVAHRLSTVQSADRILLLDQKRLVATGTHRELFESSDYYRSLVASQQIICAGEPQH